MNRDDLLRRLRELEKSWDIEGAHYDADDALIEYINDAEIKEAYEAIEKWYA